MIQTWFGANISIWEIIISPFFKDNSCAQPVLCDQVPPWQGKTSSLPDIQGLEQFDKDHFMFSSGW